MSCALAVSAFAAGRPSLRVYYQTTLTDTGWQKRAFDRLAKTWKMPASAPAVGKKCVVQTAIARDGRLISAELSMTSGVKAWDDAALDAVVRAAPYEALPAGYGHARLEVHVHVGVE